jgi:DNA (cytosine-5)-methyltransferase 1
VRRPLARPRLLDLFSGAGGVALGYWHAGFDVIGVDLNPQPGYPFPFHQADALEVLACEWFLTGFDAIHASPPCQAWTLAQRIQGNAHPDLIAPTRDLLIKTGKPYVIENVVGAPLREPAELCGCMFGHLGVYRSSRPTSAPRSRRTCAQRREKSPPAAR